MYLFFDTETTGLPRSWSAPLTDLNNWPRLVQLAWLYYDQHGKLISSKDVIVKPEGFSIPAEVSRIHGITNEIANTKGISLELVLNEFDLLVQDASYLVAHNISFDEKIVGAEYLRKRMINPVAPKKKICTMRSTTDFCGIPGKYGFKFPKLSELHYRLFHSHFDEAHNAAVDISITAKCFWELHRLGALQQLTYA
jgi:DNA polymerase III subunit epsilon